MRSIIYFIMILGSICLIASGSPAASIFMWTDENGRMHITDQPPPNGGMVRDIIEYKPGPAPQPAPLRRSDAAETKNREKAKCRNVFKARQNLLKTQTIAAAVRQRAEEARDEVQELRNRIGFDDDRRDNFKDDLKRLEENAGRAKMSAQQAELDVQVSELQGKLAELEARGQCEKEGGFY